MVYLLLISAAWFWWSFEPLQWFFDKIFMYLILNTYGWKREMLNFVHNSLSCPQCVGFWFALFITGNFYKAALVSLSCHILDLCLQRLSKD